VKDFFKKFILFSYMPVSLRKKIFFILSLFFVLFFNLYFRTFPFDLPQLKTKARAIIIQNITKGLTYEIYNRFPQFNPLARENLIKSAISNYLRFHKKEIENQTQQLYLKLKDRYQDENNKTYLFELDCWHWARYVENVVKHGYAGDEIVYNEQRDLYMTAPLGFTLLWDRFLFYFSAFLYKIFSFFKSVPLFRFLFGLPLFFMFIFILVLFCFSFSFSGYLGAIISCLFIGLAPIFIPRSCAGWFDKDILNLLFPILVVWCYLLAVVNHSLLKKIVYILLASLWIGIFCFNWTHWWFIFFIVIIYAISMMGFYIIRYFYKKESLGEFKNHLFCFSLFVVLSIIWIIVFCSSAPLVKLLQQLKLAIILNIPLMASIWPNVYATVGELRPVSIMELGDLTGGKWLFFISIFCIFYLFFYLFVRNITKPEYKGFKRELIIILFIWFFSMLFASMRGVRFVVFLLVPLGVTLGWLLNDIYTYFRYKKQNLLMVSVVLFVFVFLNFYLIQRSYRVAQALYPLMDDTWYKVLNLIKEKTPQNTVVNSWWDFGDWFKVVAKRRVIFDGQSQDSPQAYWMAKALLSKDEEEAVAILRMLNNGGNKAFEIINECLKDPLQSVLLLERVLKKDPQTAQSILKEYIPYYAAKQITEILFSRPANACFVVDYSMLSKMPAISYLGNWNFAKVYIAQNINRLEKERLIDYFQKLDYPLQDIQLFYQEIILVPPKKMDDWLSDKYYFYSDSQEGIFNDGKVFFNNGFVYDPQNNTLTSNSGQVPRSFFVFKDDKFQETVNSSPNMRFSVFIIQEADNKYSCFLADRELGNSLFTKLYFLKGKGIKHFIPLVIAQEGNNYILVYNIAW